MTSKDAYQNPMLEYRPDPPATNPETLEDVWAEVGDKDRYQIEAVFEALYESHAPGCAEHFYRFLEEYSIIFYGDKQLLGLFNRYIIAKGKEEN